MRPRIEKGRQHKARGVSLPPQMEKAALKRATAADISFSKYIQRLIAIDLERNLVQPIRFEASQAQ
jgi:hypothetical protein